MGRRDERTAFGPHMRLQRTDVRCQQRGVIALPLHRAVSKGGTPAGWPLLERATGPPALPARSNTVPLVVPHRVGDRFQFGRRPNLTSGLATCRAPT